MSALSTLLRRAGAAAAMLALVAATVAGCGDDESPGPEAGGGGAPTAIEEEQEGDVAGEATLAEVLENPSEFYGSTVTVSGEVSQVFVSPGAFALGGSVEGEDDGIGDESEGVLPVLPRQDAEVPQVEITEGDVVQATGTLCQIVANLAEVEEEDFLFEDEEAFEDESFFADFEQRPGLFASTVDAGVAEEEQLDEEGAADAEVTVTVEQQGEPSDCPGLGGAGAGTGGNGDATE